MYYKQSKYINELHDGTRNVRYITNAKSEILYWLNVMTDSIQNCLNLLETKHNLLYIRNQTVPRCKHGYKTSQLMAYTAKAAVSSEIVQNSERRASTLKNFVILSLVVRKETASL